MKTTKLLALLTALVLALSCIGTVTFGATTEITVWEYGYEDITTIPEGETYYKYTNSNNSSWHLNNTGSYGKVYVVNDSQSLNGNYMVSAAYGANYPQWTFFENPGRTLTNDFSVAFSFINTYLPDTTNAAAWTPFQLCIYPAATCTDDLPGDTAYTIFNYYYDSGAMYMKGLDDVTSSFVTYQSTWYDVKASFSNVASGSPTYTVKVKRSDSDTWTTIISDYPLPESWDCSQGLKTGKMIYHAGYSAIGFDNLKVATVVDTYDISITQPENGSLSFGEGEDGNVIVGESVSVIVTPDTGYEVESITAGDKDITGYYKNGAVSFVPTSNCTVTAVFKKVRNTTVTKNVIYGNDYETLVGSQAETIKAALDESGVYYKGDVTGVTYNFRTQWGPVWMVSGSNTYMAARGYSSASSGTFHAYVTTLCNNYPDATAEGQITMTEDFVLEFDFNNMATDPNGTDARPAGKFNLSIFPGTVTGANNALANTIASVSVGGDITVVNDTTTQTAAGYTTKQGAWYTMKVETNNVDPEDGANPTFNLYIKEQDASAYTKLAENVAFASTGDYSQGLAVYSIIESETNYNKGSANPVFAVDNIYVYTETETCDVVLEAAENGTLTFADGAETVEKGTEVTVNVTPAAGYEIDKVYLNGNETTTQGNQVTFTVNENTVVTAAFKEIPEVAPSIAQTATIEGTTHDGKPAVFAYSKLNAFTAESAVNYGMYLWQGGKTEKATAPVVLPLYAYADQNTPAVAAPGAAFAIRAFGDAITAGNTYSMLPFVGEAEGEAVEVTLPSAAAASTETP